MVRFSVTLRNTGPSATRFTLWGGLRKSVMKPGSDLVEMVGTEPGPFDVLLQPNEKVDGYWEVTRTVKEWIEIYDERATGSPGPESELTAYVDDGFDNGASYWFTLLLGGTVVEPAAAGLRETWALIHPSRTDAMDVGRRPVTAKYWVSKRQELQLREGPAQVLLED